MRTTFVFTICCMLSVAYGDTIHVPGDYTTIQEAIDSAFYGDTVLVNPSKYLENIDFKGMPITVKSTEGPLTTIIDGNSAGSVVQFINFEDSNSVLDGFTLTNGLAGIGPLGTYSGGGILCSYFVSPTIVNNIIQGNESGANGGGIYCYQCSPIILNNLIIYNEARYGAGIYCYSSEALIQNNIIAFNVFHDGYGCAIVSSNSNLIITNNTIYKNTDIGSGSTKCAGIYCLGTDLSLITNTILWKNKCDDSMQIYASNPADPIVTYCDIEGGYTGLGNINIDPFFVNADNLDFHILYASPCRDSGSSSASGIPLFDFEGDPRIAIDSADIGADEFYNHLYCTGNFIPGGYVQGKFTGLPDSTPVGLWLGSGILDPPLPSMFGDWFLQAPWFLIELWPIPSHGLLVLPATLPASIPAPYDVPMQALIGLNSASFTNLCILKVR